MELRLRIELTSAADAAREWREHLSSGGAFVRGASAEANLACTVVLADPCGRELELPAQTVYAGGDGVGVALDGFDAQLRGKVQAWIDATEDALDLDPPTTRAEIGIPIVRFGVPVEDEPEAPPDETAEEGEDEDEPERDPLARNVFERLRNLPVVAQLKVAREGEVHERKALERIYGKLVWEALLRNPRITLPEVARIARMGALPRPLLELIVGTTAWLRSPEIRRALLTNLRLTAEMIPRILRLLPKHELRLVPQQTAYPAAVRDVARRLLKDE